MGIIDQYGGYNNYTTGTATSFGVSLYNINGTQILAGDLIVFMFSYQKTTGGAFVSISDGQGNKWIQAKDSPYSSTPDTYVGVYYAFAKQNFNSGSDVVTVTVTSATKISVAYAIMGNVPQNAVIDVQATNFNATATTSHTGPSATNSAAGYSLLCIGDNSYALNGTTPTISGMTTGWVPLQLNGWTYIGAGVASNFVGIYRYKNINGGAIAAPSWTTSAAVATIAFLINIRQKVPVSTNNYSYLFSNQADTTNFSNSRFAYYSTTNVLRVDSGVATGNNSLGSPSGETRVMDLNSVYQSGTIGSKVTIKGTRGYDVTDDEFSPAILVNVGANIWRGYVCRSLNGYQRLLRCDNASTGYFAAGMVSLTAPTAYPYANNDTIELQYTPSTGVLNFLLNDQIIHTATDTTYTSNLSPGFAANWTNHGATGITDYTPTFANTIPATQLVGKTASNTTSAAQLVWSNGGEIGWMNSGYVAAKSGKVTQATIGIYDWGTSSFLKVVPYDSNGNRIGTSVALFSSSRGNGVITAQFDTPFDVIAGQKYYIGIAPNGYINLLGDASAFVGFSRMTSATGYNAPPSTLINAGGGNMYESTNFLSGYSIPSAMKMYSNNAVKVTNIVEVGSLGIDNSSTPVSRVFTDYYSSGSTFSGGSPTITSTFNSKAGDILIVAVTSQAGGSPTSASCADGSLTAGTLLQYDASREFTRIFYRKITADRTSDSVTVNWSASVNQIVVYTMLYRPVDGYSLSFDQEVAGPVSPFTTSSTTSSYNIGGAGFAIGFVGMNYQTAGTTTTIESSFTKFSAEITGTAFISEKFPTSALTTQTTTATSSVNEYLNIHVMSFLATKTGKVYDFNETNGTKLATINPAFYGQYATEPQTLSGSLVATSFGGSIKVVYGKGFKANQSSQVTKTNSINTGQWVSIHAITDQTSDGYALAVRTGTTGAELYRAGSVVAGPYTIASAPASSTTTIKLESVAQANGSLIINSYRNGSLIGSYTDNYPLPVGKPAFWISTTSAASDDAIDQFVAGGEAPKSQLYANGTFVVGEYIEN